MLRPEFQEEVVQNLETWSLFLENLAIHHPG
jgi:hypothetical protein